MRHAQKQEEHILWYTQPAQNWNEALPLGNGKLGVMVFGNTANERIQLNDDSMWPADSENWTEPKGNKKILTGLELYCLKEKMKKLISFCRKFFE